MKSKPGSYKFKVVLTDPTIKKKEDQQMTFFPKESCAPKELAKHTCAVVALHHLCGEKPLHRILPPQFKSFWEELDVQAKDQQVKQEAIEKKQEERKEKQELLQKRLERLPQVYIFILSLTSLSLSLALSLSLSRTLTFSLALSFFICVSLTRPSLHLYRYL